MSLLERVISAHKCRSMHHHIALDALSLLEGPDALAWKNVLLRYNNALFQGAKAPDKKFRDFQNHVLHVSEGGWGGAKDAAMEWYAKSVEALKRKNWEKAAYSLGVMSHYYADVCQPFHTGQTEEEGAVHRAVEWSIFKSAEKLQERIVSNGYPEIERPAGAGFVGEMVQAAADASHPYYNVFIDHYNIDAGVEDPELGPDGTLLDAAATCFAHATAGVAVLFSAAIEEAGVAAPKTHLTLRGYLAYLGIPERKIINKLDDMADRRQVQKMYRELKKTGKVVKTLPDDDKAIRAMHARIVLRKPIKELDAEPIRELGSKHLPLIEDVADPIVASPFESTSKEKTITPDDAIVADAVSAESLDIIEETIDVNTTPAPLEAPEEVEEEIIADAVDEAAGKIADPVDHIDMLDDAALDAHLDELVQLDAAETQTDEIDLQAIADAEREAAKEESKNIRAREGRLNFDSPIADAPSIGKKTAKRFKKVGITTIEDLLDCDVQSTVESLSISYIDQQTLIDWQDQVMLKMEVPSLRTLDVQILVGAGIRSANALAEADTAAVFDAAKNFLNSENGLQVSRNVDAPIDENTVDQWIDKALYDAA